MSYKVSPCYNRYSQITAKMTIKKGFIVLKWNIIFASDNLCWRFIKWILNNILLQMR
jgi:hypothetical protein